MGRSPRNALHQADVWLSLDLNQTESAFCPITLDFMVQAVTLGYRAKESEAPLKYRNNQPSLLTKLIFTSWKTLRQKAGRKGKKILPFLMVPAQQIQRLFHSLVPLIPHLQAIT